MILAFWYSVWWNSKTQPVSLSLISNRWQHGSWMYEEATSLLYECIRVVAEKSSLFSQWIHLFLHIERWLRSNPSSHIVQMKETKIWNIFAGYHRDLPFHVFWSEQINFRISVPMLPPFLPQSNFVLIAKTFASKKAMKYFSTSGHRKTTSIKNKFKIISIIV